MNQPTREELKLLLIRNEAGQEDYLNFKAGCVRKFGPAAGIFLRQLVYWTGKEHDPEGWIYKTQSEMEVETGLSRKQQEKARKILRSQGVINEQKKGVPCQLWYRVDLEALRRIMETPRSTMNQRRGNRDDDDDSEQMNEGYSSLAPITDRSSKADSTVLASENGNTFPSSEARNSSPASKAHTNDRAITESTAEITAESSSDNYSAENSILQIGASLASHGSTPNKQMGSTDTPKTSIGGLELNRIYYLLTTPNSKTYEAYALYLKGGLSSRDLASEVSIALTGSRDQMESYIDPVQRMVAELAKDDVVSD
jgi:hypothetical protein